MKKVCIICNTPFESCKRNAIVCGKPLCLSTKNKNTKALWRKLHPEVLKRTNEKRRIWYSKNYNKVRKHHRIWRSENKYRIRLYSASHYKTHRVKVLERSNSWKRFNKNRTRDSDRIYRFLNPIKTAKWSLGKRLRRRNTNLFFQMLAVASAVNQYQTESKI